MPECCRPIRRQHDERLADTRRSVDNEKGDICGDEFLEAKLFDEFSARSSRATNRIVWGYSREGPCERRALLPPLPGRSRASGREILCGLRCKGT